MNTKDKISIIHLYVLIFLYIIGVLFLLAFAFSKGDSQIVFFSLYFFVLGLINLELLYIGGEKNIILKYVLFSLLPFLVYLFLVLLYGEKYFIRYRVLSTIPFFHFAYLSYKHTKFGTKNKSLGSINKIKNTTKFSIKEGYFLYFLEIIGALFFLISIFSEGKKEIVFFSIFFFVLGLINLKMLRIVREKNILIKYILFSLLPFLIYVMSGFLYGEEYFRRYRYLAAIPFIYYNYLLFKHSIFGKNKKHQ